MLHLGTIPHMQLLSFVTLQIGFNSKEAQNTTAIKQKDHAMS